MKFMHITSCFLLLFIFLACSQPEKKDQNSSLAADTLLHKDTRRVLNEFSVRKGELVLSLRDWKSTLNLQRLGTRTDSTSYILGEGADTHRGSRIEEICYGKLLLHFLGPPGKKDVWIQHMELSGSDWETMGGVRVGDSLEDLKSKYPEATNEFSGNDKHIYRYTSGESVMEFRMKDEKIELIQLSYMIP